MAKQRSIESPSCRVALAVHSWSASFTATLRGRPLLNFLERCKAKRIYDLNFMAPFPNLEPDGLYQKYSAM
eukprot:8640573-Pyramimonas_sp.AAC.1